MLSQQIKEATKQGHQELEKIVVQRLKSIQSEADYALVLKYFYAYFQAVENKIHQHIPPSLAPYYAKRRDAAYLKKDILELGGHTSDIPQISIPEINNCASAIGALYVLEGSILGGPYIVQMLKKLGIDKGFNFFAGYAEQTTQNWEEFTSLINAEVQDYDGLALSLIAAQDTFHKFALTFETTLSPIQG